MYFPQDVHRFISEMAFGANTGSPEGDWHRALDLTADDVMKLNEYKLTA